MKKVKTAPLTAEEKAWFKKLQKLLKECPSTRLDALALGETELIIYDDQALQKWEEQNPDMWKLSRQDKIEESRTELKRLSFPFYVGFEM